MPARGAHTTTRHHGVHYAPGAGLGASYPVGSIFEPDFLLVSQWFDRQGGAAQRAPEQLLMLAVVETALRDLCGTTGGTLSLVAHRGRPNGREVSPRESLQENAVAWFASDDTRWPFSVVNICDTFGVDVDWLRRGLARLVARRGLEPQGSGSGDDAGGSSPRVRPARAAVRSG